MSAQSIEWLDPWWPTEGFDREFHEAFRNQLELELPPGHAVYGLPVRLIARGNGDDALFEITDGSGRVALVHLTWSKSQERLPWPRAAIFRDLQEFIRQAMIPDHQGMSGNSAEV